MTEAWFYVTDEAGPESGEQLLVRLLERALRSRRQLYVHCDNPQAAESLSGQLWQGTRFIPHGLHGSGASQQLLLGHGDDPGEHHDILINLSSAVPDHFSRFERVIELVTGEATSRAQSREKWTFYKHRGYPVERHELG